MTPNAEAIARLAQQRPAGPERDAYLAETCGHDASLRMEVEAILKNQNKQEQHTSFGGGAETELPDPSPAGAGTIRLDSAEMGPASEGPGQVIGRYKLLQLIGEGGFGSVFMAEQEKPVQRKVALKIIKLGMDTRQVIARFEAERQALALMDHPNIARVLDAGATDTGRPYFVMELVKGEPIVEYCDKNNLSINERLELFALVCAAVQHAHTKGIIHRDLKPSNILVSMQDGRPAPKVIDFGIAKATASKLTEKTLFTEHRQLIGTPEYMSPEQAEGSLDIDTRTDVYSLGVLLYELLTGFTPFSHKELRAAAFAEIQRIIREVEPPKPSTRLSQDTATIASVAAHRHTEPRTLTTLVRGELDWIVMKALEKDRTRRYETANGLSRDIQRYLANEVIEARPMSRAYRFRKLIVRNKGVVAAAAAVAIALLLGVVAFAWQATIARHQRDLAVQARKLADDQRLRAVAAETQARQRADELHKVADFQGQMLAQVDPTSAGIRLTEDVRARFAAALEKSGVPENQRPAANESFATQWGRVNATDTAREFIDQAILKPAVAAIDKQFIDQPVVAASLRSTLAERYHDLGLDEVALGLAQQALAERRRVLGPDHPDTLLAMNDVGAFLAALGRYADAEPYYREALDKSRRVRGNDHRETLMYVANMGSLFHDRGQLTEAEPYYREALEKRRQAFGEDDPDTLASLNDWGRLMSDQGKLDDSEKSHREALAKRRRILGEEHTDTLASANDLAVLLKKKGKLDNAISLFRELADKRRRILGDTHPRTLTSIQNLGSTLDEAGHSDQAEGLLREALEKQRRLLGADHGSTLTSQGNFCVFLIGQNKFTEAEPLCRDTLERRRRVLGPDHPETLIADNVMGLVLVRQNKPAEAEPYWRAALEADRRTLGPAHPDTLIMGHNLGRLMLDEKKPDEAEKLFREVIQNGGPAIGTGHPTVLSATRQLGALLLEQKRYAEAFELLSAAEPYARKTYTGSSERNLGGFLSGLGRAQNRVAKYTAAESSLLEANAIFIKPHGPTHPDALPSTKLLVEFYTAWDKAEPGKGHDAQAAEWTKKVEAIPPPAPNPSASAVAK